eukprot:TRINITY_DN42174_c0_g2_i1.p1 TRINITY_DN42174_c0_g2~~TRINITY_DN42174_c0_g2_i1.p1  ORF type:complete len:234 (-),score=76.87 TRINITY_DN42174_c0_g2_i1:57-731(-)
MKLLIVALFVFGLLAPTSYAQSGEFCSLCIDFFNNAINELLDVILNGGVIGSCDELCGYLTVTWEETVCNLACDVVGIEAFIKLIDDVDPDPIYYCEVTELCSYNPDANATISAISVTPAKGKAGDTFTINVDFVVYDEIYTGELDINVIPPDAFPFGNGELLINQATGGFGASLQFQANPSEQEPFDPGNYTAQAAICSGTCGSDHPHARILGVKSCKFQIIE